MASTGTIGVGLVGYGLAGRLFHSPYIAGVDGLRLAAIATSEPGSAGPGRRAITPDATVVGTVDGAPRAPRRRDRRGGDPEPIPRSRSGSGRCRRGGTSSWTSRSRWMSRKPRRSSRPRIEPGGSCRSTRTAGGTATSRPCERWSSGASSARSTASRPGSSDGATSARRGASRPMRQGARIVTSARTWWTRACCCSDRLAASSPRWTDAGPTAWSTTRRSSPSIMSTAGAPASGRR